jgi:hypothetical protein
LAWRILRTRRTVAHASATRALERIPFMLEHIHHG